MPYGFICTAFTIASGRGEKRGFFNFLAQRIQHT
jgi:hypothetical protein